MNGTWLGTRTKVRAACFDGGAKYQVAPPATAAARIPRQVDRTQHRRNAFNSPPASGEAVNIDGTAGPPRCGSERGVRRSWTVSEEGGTGVSVNHQCGTGPWPRSKVGV